MANAVTLHQQWAKRSQDESFESLEALHNFCVNKKMQSRQADVNLSELTVKPFELLVDKDGRETEESSRVEQTIDSLHIVLPNGKELIPGNYAFSQLCKFLNVPVSLVTDDIPARLVADILNHKLGSIEKVDTAKIAEYDLDDISQRPVNKSVKLLWSENGANFLRAVNSANYGRYWDDNVTKIALALADKYNLHPAPAAFDGKRGLYASLDGSDVFICLVDSERKIFESLPGGGLSRGVMLSNSEAGKLVFWLCGFGYMYICGNHNIYGFEKQFEIRMKHSKNLTANVKTAEIEEQLTHYLEASPEHEEKLIKVSMDTILGKDKKEVVETIVKKTTSPLIGKKFTEKLFDMAETRVDWYGAPNTAWSMGNALTEFAKASPYGDRRQALEIAAAEIMSIGQ